MMEKIRLEIIDRVSEYFRNKNYVQACWLGWSDANNETDQYSDIDYFICANDEKIDFIFEEVQKILWKIWTLDYISTIYDSSNQKWQTFHISWTPESLHIEVWLIKKSIWMTFENWNPAFKPKIIFDKDNIIKFKEIDKIKLTNSIIQSLGEYKDFVKEYARVEKYIKRWNYIEATNYYIKYIFMPLVGVLRIYYTPILYNWWRIHISRHFPNDIVIKLEQLMKFNSFDDLEKNLNSAQKWFWEIVKNIEEKNDLLIIDLK